MLNTTEEIKEQKFSELGILTFRNDEILTFEPKPGVKEQTVESMKMDFEILKEWACDRKFGFLVDSRSFKKFDSDVRVYAQEKAPLFADMYAIIISSGMSSFLANMFIYMNKPVIPTKTFTTKEKALTWLNSL